MMAWLWVWVITRQSAGLRRFPERGKDVVQLFAGNEFDRGNHRLPLRGPCKFIFMVFLDEFASPMLDGAAHIFQVRAPYLDGHEAVEQRKAIIEIGAVHYVHQIPGLWGLRRLQHAADFQIRGWAASFIEWFVGFLSCAGLRLSVVIGRS